jgi:hypothetical protein
MSCREPDEGKLSCPDLKTGVRVNPASSLRDNALSAAGLDFVEISVESIVEHLIGFFGRRVLVFPDAQTLGTESNLTPLKLQIISLSGDPPLSITRLPPEDAGDEDLPDPNEPGRPPLR